jgi:translation initiation factor IF-1
LNRIKFKLIAFLFFLLVGGSIFFFPSASSAEYSPFDVPSTVRSGWNKTPGGKHYKENTGRMLIYDVYYNKYISGGQRIVNKNFNGTGTQPYLEFRGWSVIFGHKRHLSSNNETYIAAQKVAGSGAGAIKIFKAQQRGLYATEDLEYNNQGSGIYNECSASTTNTPNYDCNMRYESVGFDAYLPLNELFPDDSKDAVWSLYLIKKVDSHIVYTPLIVPFDFSNRDFKYGSISLSSGQNTNKLTMNTDEVLRRSKPREAAASVRDELGSDRYFTNNTTYTRVDSEESQTAVWYGVRSPKDSNKTKWAATSYWRFSGDQARISYITENDPPEHIADSITNHRYRDGSNHWVQPNDTVTVMLRQYDKESGNKNQFLRMLGSGVEVRARHDFFDATNHNYHWVKSNHLVIEAAKRTENTKYGKVEWSVTPKTHGHTYDVQYHYTDNVGNAVGYDTGSGNTGLKLSVDGVAPTNITNSLTGARYINGNDYWVRENESVTITLRQRDPHSGNKYQYLRLLGSGVEVRSRHDFAAASDYNNHWIKSNHLVIDEANRTENTDYGTVKWNVTPKTHGHNYDIQYHYFDNVNNGRGYDTGEGDTGMNLRVDSVSPSHISHSLTGAKYVNNNVYWVNSDDKVTVQLRQHDGDSGNKRQYLRLAGNNIDVRSSHYFSESTNHQDSFFKSSHAVIEAANRQEQTAYGKVNWTVVPKTHGHLYDIQYYYQDNVDNISNVVIDESAKGYQSTNMKLGVDDAGPVIQYRNNEDTADFSSRDWSKESIKVRLKFNDAHSGYKRSRYVWTQSSSTPTESQWSSWSTNSNYVVTKSGKGQWYLHVQSEDNVGNVSTTYKGAYKFNNPPVAGFNTDKTTYYRDGTIKVTSTATDPDGDPLTYHYVLVKADGTKVTSTSVNPSFTGLDKPGTFTITQTVKDPEGATDSITKSVEVVNRPPTAGFKTDKAKYFNNESINITSTASDIDGDKLTYVYELTKPDGSKVTSSAASPTFNGLQLIGVYSIKQTVKDTYNATDTITKTIEVVNRPSTITLTYDPSDPYEGDTINVCMRVHDSDGHKMDVKIFITEEGTAEKTVLTKTKVVSDTEHCYSFVSKHKKYIFRANSDDGYDETEVTTWVNVKPLTLKGYVKHTPDWQNKHQSLGHKDNQFYSGEKFLLEADVSPYPIEYVKSTLKATQANSVSINRTVSLGKTTSILYKGELYDPAFIEYPTNIKPGPAIFEFEVKYTNGVIKKDSVPIEILADSYKAFKLHRKY